MCNLHTLKMALSMDPILVGLHYRPVAMKFQDFIAALSAEEITGDSVTLTHHSSNVVEFTEQTQITEAEANYPLYRGQVVVVVDDDVDDQAYKICYPTPRSAIWVISNKSWVVFYGSQYFEGISI